MPALGFPGCWKFCLFGGVYHSSACGCGWAGVLTRTGWDTAICVMCVWNMAICLAKSLIFPEMSKSVQLPLIACAVRAWCSASARDRGSLSIRICLTSCDDTIFITAIAFFFFFFLLCHFNCIKKLLCHFNCIKNHILLTI